MKLVRLFIGISLCVIFLSCAGCGQSLFSLGKKTELVPPHSAISPKSPVPLSAVSSNAPGKPVCYDTTAEYTSSYHNSVLSEDVTFSGKVLITGVLTIAPQATLNILPGTIVSFLPDPLGPRHGALLVQGRIAAVGTADKVVVFRAPAVDMNQDSWQGIIVLGSEKKNLFEYCRIEGATVGLDSIFSTLSLKNTFIYSCRTGVRLQGGLFQALGGGVSASDQGYFLRDSESYLRDISCADNARGLFLSRGSLKMKGSSFLRNTARALDAVDAKIEISGASFSRNGTGIALAGSEGTIESCKIDENREYGLQLADSTMKIVGNQIYMNIGIGIMSDNGRSVAWRNNISLNGLFDFYNAGSDEFRAIGNWWGVSVGPAHKRHIFDKSVDPERGSVLTFPELSAPPPGLP